MQHSDTLAAIGAALNKAQAAVKVAIKDADNPHLRTKYADLGSVWDACREALHSNGLSVLQMPATDEPGYIALETILLHTSGEFISERSRIPVGDVKSGKETAQAVGSGLTYLRRYALSAALGIVADEDDDGHAASQARTAQSRLQQPSQAQRQQAAPVATDPSQDTRKIGERGAERLRAELLELGVKEPLAHARKVLDPNIPDLTELAVWQARVLKQNAPKARA